MSARGEKALIQHLPDSDSLKALAREGLPEECVPSETLREIYLWAMDVYFRSGMVAAPSVEAMQIEWGDQLSDHEIPIDEEPEDSIEWVIDDLKGSFLNKHVQVFGKSLVTNMAGATNMDKVAVLSDFASQLVSLSVRMASQESRVDIREAMEGRLRAYESREADRESIYGMRFGLREIDDYTHGIHPGELAILAAGPKVGKSYALDLFALREWQAGRSVMLFTLENSVEMTLDRMACLALGINPSDWERGECRPDQIESVRNWVEGLKRADVPLYVFQPDVGSRSVEYLVRQAQVYDVDSLLIDQLTFLEPEDERAPRHLQIREMTHDLKSMISTARKRIPCVMAHQINREGVKAADKAGHLEMYHLAEGSEVERTADWVFGIHRSKTEVSILRAKFQTLASRRAPLRHFMLDWAIDAGMVRVRNEFEIET